MAFDERLAERIRLVVPEGHRISEKKMFGGLAFLSNGKMFCGIVRDELMVRVGPENYEVALAKPHVREMDFTGRPMAGYVFVEPEGTSSASALSHWIELGLTFVGGLEAGKAKRKPAKRR